jgi:hypothetical protein
MPEASEAREVHPFRDFKGNGVTKDFSLNPVKLEAVEDNQSEADPKAESARESAASLQSVLETEQTESGTPAPSPAVKENPPSSSKSEGSTPKASPSPETSSPDSSSPTSPGKSVPPAPVLPPPTSGETPQQ